MPQTQAKHRPITAGTSSTTNTSSTPVSPLTATGAATRIAARLLLFAAVASTAIWALQRVAGVDPSAIEPAGFWRGIQHGVLMPIALPTLLLGHDVPIYALNNTGRIYKLGYTLGVNGCGAIFFGISFWRLQRWRRRGR